ncbi:MAG: hypothetical protein CMJ93_07615 [Planctomycetes bacterium]|nr:hypothetical protein [Planctomycetota bacterium]
MKLIPNTSCINLGFALCGIALLFGCVPSPAAPSVSNFGISSCSLGCNGQSFSTSQHFENQDIKFTFNDAVDPASVDNSSISIVDSDTGVQPTGTLIVRGSDVIFRPTLSQTVDGLSYGFAVGGTYRVAINGKNSVSVVKSLKGYSNQSTITGEITIEPATDLNPGSPSLDSISPDATEEPSSRFFPIDLVFDDIMQVLPLANPETGESTLVSVTSYEPLTDIRLEIPGFYSATIDRDNLTTTLTFSPSVAYPSSDGYATRTDGGGRYLEVTLSQQISDISNNNLTNPGPNQVLLIDAFEEVISFNETFADSTRRDTAGSVFGLWGSTSYLDSGQSQDGSHSGGGSGALGHFAPNSSSTIAFNTDGFSQVYSNLLEKTVVVNDGFYPFSEVLLPSDNSVIASGSNPLRLVSQGDFVSDSKILISGSNAPGHFGKAFYAGVSASERDGDEVANILYESILGSSESPSDDQFFGGDGAIGVLGGGNGGSGGDTWFADSIGFGGGAYFSTIPVTWSQFIEDGFTPGNSRYNAGLGATDDRYSGNNGQGVGGATALGSPIGSPNDILGDLENGSGMGSWCWPPRSNEMPAGAVIETHSDKGFILHRSRGGGGGGYWTDGARGNYFVENSLNGLGQNMSENDLIPEVNDALGIYEYNGRDDGSDKFAWDISATTPNQVADASGGQFVITAGFESLDPSQGFLLGGSGGGGAGMGQHGSIANRVLGAGVKTVGTWRSGAGGGGGAGGGAIHIFAGNDLSLTGALESTGGDGATSNFVESIPFYDAFALLYGPPGDAGGGGGSGGAVLLEAAGTMQLGPEVIDVSGGLGGLGAVGNHGGDGGSGVVRFNTATGLESLAFCEDAVEPDFAVQSNPVALDDVPNVGTVGNYTYAGTTGDVNLQTGELINGNASGVRSLWYEPSAEKYEIALTGYTITCDYSLDGGTNITTLVFSDQNLTNPDENSGATAVWIAFQGAWMHPGESLKAQPELVTVTPWFVPGLTVATSGMDEFNSFYNRALRFRLVFDQDVIAGLLSGGTDSWFRVTSVNFDTNAS